MRVTPFHHENYSRLILGVVMQFYQRCSDRFQSLTTRTPAMPGVVADPSQFRTPAAWAQRSELMKCLLALLASSVSCLLLVPFVAELTLVVYQPDDAALRRTLCQEETRLELAVLASNRINAEDTLGSPRLLSSLANLHQSLVSLRSGTLGQLLI